MPLVPLLLTVSLVGPVISVTCHLSSLPKAFSGTLAGLIAAVTLLLHSRVRAEKAAAMGTSDFAVHGLPPKKPQT